MTNDLFHPAVAAWFDRQFDEPSAIQKRAWPVIKQRQNTLIAAPTGSGKTLAAFLSSIDDLVRQGQYGTLEEGTQIVYVSPLKALSNDIHANLQVPLKGIKTILKERGWPDVPIRVAVRTGDTPTSERAAMTKHPPHILVTTPESLYLLLTSAGGRRILPNVHTLIIDEIHALVGNKRGSHLALSVERLERLTSSPLTRIGISATQKPIDRIAHFLTGAAYDKGKGCKILNTGHRRKLELKIEVPRSPLGAVMSNEVWEEVYERLEELILRHETTLIFVTTRSMSERLARHLSERLGTEHVTSHHGSMSKEHRHDAEQRLKAGALKALVATASLELGIDIGSVDLVCQIGSPKAIATLIQRAGRSGHTITGTPKGRLFPLTRDELVEAAAIMDSVRRGELDRIIIPEQPLDVLAQQIIAEVANCDFQEDDLYHLVRRAYPYRDLTREEFDGVVSMLAEGYTPRRGRKHAYIQRDLMNGAVRGRKGARINALMSGGTIPDQFDYDVIMEPTETFIGTLNEDFAIESTAGDIVQLGNNSWRILRVEKGKIRVEDAQGLPPTMPFWFGEAPGRTVELSASLSRLREEVASRMDVGFGPPKDGSEETGPPKDGGEEVGPTPGRDSQGKLDPEWKREAEDWLMTSAGVSHVAATQIAEYLGATKAALGVIPSQKDLVAERFFDEAGDMHLVLHSPFGSRVNRAWGLALRKRFCRTFNFELQAAANEDSIILSLGATHSFPLDDVFSYLNAKTVREVLVQALLDAPMFEVRWRWNASTALAVLRRRGGDRVPPQIQRSVAEDLIAQVFPDQIACLENIAGDREVPDHPLVSQTIEDCLHEAMDVETLETVLKTMKSGDMNVHARDLREPSPMAEEILNARPYAFLDDAPLEERRTNAVRNRRWLDPAVAGDLGRLDPEAIDTVRSDAWPEVRSPDELHDALVLAGYVTEEEGRKGDQFGSWTEYYAVLEGDRRAATLVTEGGKRLWTPLERRIHFERLHPQGRFEPAEEIPDDVRGNLEKGFQATARQAGLADASATEEYALEEYALVELIRGRLETLGPVTAAGLAGSIDLPVGKVDQALIALESEGFVFRGQFSPDAGALEWCERRLLARIHRFTITKLRREIQPVSPADFMQFLFTWHHLAPDTRLKGADAVAAVLRMLEGVEAPAAAWESEILPSRVTDYDYAWLDSLCLSGKYAWGRLRPHRSNGENGKTAGPIRSTPIAIVDRMNRSLWMSLSGAAGDEELPLSTYAKTVLDLMTRQGAVFFDDITAQSGLLRTHTEEAVAELVSAGMVTSDSFAGLRALLVPSRHRESRRGRERRNPFDLSTAGRWGLTSRVPAEGNAEEDLEAYARVALARYGVVFRRLTERENASPPWRDLVRVLRRMEARGEIRGGRFVNGVWGEQYALGEAVTLLRSIRRKEKQGTLVAISAADPLNLVGIITPGRRVPGITSNRILYRDGEPILIMEGGEIRETSPVAAEEQWALRQELVKRDFPPKLKAYLSGRRTREKAGAQKS
ncbi:MAG: DEAD/DEAH box helicase [Gemmatimonadetes bacterium]|nr:DEAD/DEAH box helicase [Gemmatimonadota bacterium]